MSEVLNIFIDSNVYIKSKYHFSSGPFETLKRYSDLGIIKLITSDIVNREVESNIDNDCTAICSALRKVFKKNNLNKELSDLDGYQFLLRDFKKDNWSEHIIGKFYNYLNSVDATVLSCESITLDKIFNDYFDVVPPFEKKETKKYEFPDAAIILSIKEFIIKEKNIIIVSDDDGWKKSFKNNEHVVFFNDLKKALLYITESIIDEESAKGYFDFIIKSSCLIDEKINDYLFNLYWDDLIENDYCIEIDDVNDFEIIDFKKEFKGFDYIDDEYATANFIVSVEAKIAYSYDDYSYSTYDREDDAYYGIRHNETEELHKFELELNVFIENEEDGFYALGDFEFETFELSGSTLEKTLSDSYYEIDDDF